MLTLTTFSVLTRFLGFLYKIYLSRIMTTTELGIYNLTLSVYMVLITIVSSSIPLTISKITSHNKSAKREFSTNYSVTSSLILTTIISIVLVLIVLFCRPLLVLIIGSDLGYEIIIALIPSIIFSAIYSQIRGFLWGHENYFGVSIVEFVEQLLRIAFCILFIYLDIFSSPAIAVGVALSIACGISTLYGFVLYFKNGGKFRFKHGYFKEIITSSLPLTGVRLFGSLLQPLVAIMLPLMLTNLGMDREFALGELGIIMGMSLPIISIPSTIIGSLCMILVPRISSTDNNRNKLIIQIENYILFSLVCLFAFVPIFIVLGAPLCEFVFDNAQSGIYLCYCVWIIIPMGLAQITTSILNALNQENKSFIYFVISSIFMFIAIIILPKFIGIMAMGFSIGVSNIVLAILNFNKIKKLTNYSPQIIRKLITQLLIIIPIILITKLSYNWTSIIFNNLISICICAAISVMSYIMLLFVFNIISYKSVIAFMSKNFRKNNAKQLSKQ